MNTVGHHGSMNSVGAVSSGFKFADKGSAPTEICNMTEKGNIRGSAGKGPLSGRVLT